MLTLLNKQLKIVSYSLRVSEPSVDAPSCDAFSSLLSISPQSTTCQSGFSSVPVTTVLPVTSSTIFVDPSTFEAKDSETAAFIVFPEGVIPGTPAKCRVVDKSK